MAFGLVIEFTLGTKLYREPEVVPKLPIVQNGPPGTFVVFPEGGRVPVPSDKFVLAEDGGGFAKVAFGGMCFDSVPLVGPP